MVRRERLRSLVSLCPLINWMLESVRTAAAIRDEVMLKNAKYSSGLKRLCNNRSLTCQYTAMKSDKARTMRIEMIPRRFLEAI
jgi:hypothetical protein